MTSLVLWHGWGMSCSCWHALVDTWSNNPTLETVLGAHPGYDGTPVPDNYDLDSAVSAMMKDVTTPITLCGWSLGSLLAIKAAHNYPEKVEKLILIGSTASFIQRDGWAYGMEPIALSAFKKGVSLDAWQAIQRFIMLFNQNDSNKKSIARELAKTDLPETDVLVKGLDLLRDIDHRDLIPKIKQPTLLIHGRHDPLMPLHAAQWLANTLPNGRLEIIERAAHAPFLSDTMRCSSLIADFCQ